AEAVLMVANTPTSSHSTSAVTSSQAPAPAENGLARSVVSANNSGRVIRSASVSTAISVSTRTPPTTPAPAVAASPTDDVRTANTRANPPGSTATKAAGTDADVGEPSAA